MKIASSMKRKIPRNITVHRKIASIVYTMQTMYRYTVYRKIASSL
jgi:hypothetical protein